MDTLLAQITTAETPAADRAAETRAEIALPWGAARVHPLVARHRLSDEEPDDEDDDDDDEDWDDDDLDEDEDWDEDDLDDDDDWDEDDDDDDDWDDDDDEPENAVIVTRAPRAVMSR